MSILKDAMTRLRSWLGERRRRKGKTLIIIHLGNVTTTPDAGRLAAVGIHEACSRSGIGASVVNIDEWILRACLNEGRFDPHRLVKLRGHDLATGEPNWERGVKTDIVWLLRRRRELLSEAYNAGGDADVAVVLSEEDSIEPILCVDFSNVSRLVDIHIHPPLSGQTGFIATYGSARQASVFRFGANAVDDLMTWKTVLKDCLRPAG